MIEAKGLVLHLIVTKCADLALCTSTLYVPLSTGNVGNTVNVGVSPTSLRGCTHIAG